MQNEIGKDVMRNLKEVFCHLHSHSQPRYPHFTLCPYCREEAPHEAIVVEAAVNYFSLKLRDFFIETELEIQMGTAKRRADIVLVDGKQNHAAIVECKRIGVRDDGIGQLNSYLCATDTPLGVFANSTVPNDWEYVENLGRNRFKDLTSDLFWKNIRDTSEEKSTQPTADAETYYKQGKVNYDCSQYEDAVSNYNQAIHLNPDYAIAYISRGNARFYLGQYAAAIADFDTAIQLKSDDVDAYVVRGAAKGALAQYAAAIADYDAAIQLKSDDAYAYYFRGLVKGTLQQFNAAIVDYDAAIQLKPDYAEVYFHRGKTKAGLGQHTAAIADYDIAIQLKPDYAEAYYERGNAKPLTKFGKGNLGQQNNAANTQALRNLSLTFPDPEQYATAIADYDNAIRLKPDYAEAYYARGNMKFKALRTTERDPEQYLAVIADFDNVIRLKPDDVIAYYDRGNAKMKLRQYTAAIADFDNVIRLKPDDATAYHVRGNAKVELGQYAAAIADYDTAIRLKPDYTEVYDDRGHAKDLIGRPFAALADAYRASHILKKKYGR